MTDSKIYSIRIKKDIREKLDNIAKKQNRKTANLINLILSKYINKYENNFEKDDNY